MMKTTRTETFLNGIRANDKAHHELFRFMLKSTGYKQFTNDSPQLDEFGIPSKFLRNDIKENNYSQKRTFYLNYLT